VKENERKKESKKERKNKREKTRNVERARETGNPKLPVGIRIDTRFSEKDTF
jgi:hypothetical protein